MECKNCTKYKNDCGHHFKDSNGHIDYDCPAESVCDRYGCCEYYKESRSEFDVAWNALNELVRNNLFPTYSAQVIANHINELNEYKKKYLDLCR